MPSEEKLRALLVEARRELGCIEALTVHPGVHNGPGGDALFQFLERIEAALAEPVAECARCETLRDLADKAAWAQGDAQRRMIKAQQERDAARAEVETLRAAIDGEPWGGAVLKQQRDEAIKKLGVTLEELWAAEKERDEARDEVERLTQSLAMAEQVSGVLCDDCGWAMKFPDEPCRCEIVKQLDEARAEIERLRGITPELPPRPPDGAGLPRYGLRWNGPTEPVAVPMLDGYWTPWHLTDAKAQRFEIERTHTGRALDEAVALQRAACAAAYQRGAEAMREAAAAQVAHNRAILPVDTATDAAWCRSAACIEGVIRDMPVPEDKP